MLKSLLPITVENLHFGERDALHEFMKQDRQGLSILEAAFVVPPRIKMDDLYSGARCFIVGPKGSGKTTLLWHLKRHDLDNSSAVVLFKSHIRKEDRDLLDKLINVVVVEDQKSYKIEADYKTVWEWYILKAVFRLISPEAILSGQDTYRDISLLLETNNHKFNTIYDKFHVDRVKGAIKLAVDVGALKSEIAAEIEARRTAEGKMQLLELVRLIIASLPLIKLKSEKSVRVYFDELEFFLSEDGDGDRDRRLVRDLLFSAYNMNTHFGNAGLNIIIFASLRSELLNSIKSTAQEIGKIIDAFGVNLNWYHDAIEQHPVLTIFENKIRLSEIEATGYQSDDPFQIYFPNFVGTKEFRRYLLDTGLHRPRGVLLRIKAAAELAFGNKVISSDNFIQSEGAFGAAMLEEFLEEISASFDETAKEVVLSLFRGNHYAFSTEELEQRLRARSHKDKIAKRILSEVGIKNLIRLLFRVGMIGNQFDINEGVTAKHRQEWAFRGATDPIFEKRFVLHQSVRKTLVTI